MKELVFILVVGMLILLSVLMRPSYKYDTVDNDPIKRLSEKHHRFPPVYRDPQFGSASGGSPL